MGSDAEILWEVARVLAREAAEVSRPPRRPLPPLLFFTDPARTPKPWETAERLPVGAGVVFRHFGAADARETAMRLKEVATRRGLSLLIGMDADLAETVGADGLHLPERALGRGADIAGARPDWLLTGAAHRSPDARSAGSFDALVVSPVFPAGGASGDRPAMGIDAFRAVVARSPAPAYALGGIDARTSQSLLRSGACGIAAVSAIASAFGP